MFSSIKNKALRITAIVVSGILSLFVLLLIIANIYVRTNKEFLLNVINSNINKNLSGKFEVKNIELSTFAHFPNIAVDLENIELLDSVYHRPLMQCELLSCRFSIFKLWDIKHQLSKLVLTNSTVHFFTDSSGYKNTAMFKKKEKTASKEKGTFIIHRVEINNMSFKIDDLTKAKHYDFQFNKLSASLKNNDSVLHVDLMQKTLIRKMIFNDAKGSYLENQLLEGPFDLDYNTSAKNLICNKSNIKINGEKYTLTALFRLAGQPNFHIDATVKKLPYSKGLALLTPKLKNTLGIVQIKDPLNVHATIDGLMKFRAIPAINIQWKTQQNELTAGGVAFKDCSFEGTFTNQVSEMLPRTDEYSRVVLKTFSGNLDGLQLDGTNIVITNLLKPYAQFNLVSKAALNELENRFAFEHIKFLKGTAQVNLVYDGPLLADLAALKNLTAQINIKDGQMLYEPKNALLENCSGEISVGANKLLFKKFQFDVWHNHIEINVSGNDIASFSTQDQGKAAVLFELYSPHLHFDEISGLLSADTQQIKTKKKGQFTAVTQSVNNIFNDLDFRVNINADTISRDLFYAHNLKANLFLRKDIWQLENISMRHAGGIIQLSGSLKKNGNARALLAMDLRLQQLNVQQLFYAFNNFGQAGITSNNLHGTLTADGKLNMQLYKGGSAVKRAGTNGYIDFSLKNGAIVNHKGLEQVKVLFLKDRDMSNIRFAELKDRIDINPNDIYINRMEIESTAITMYVEGRYDFLKKNTDILIQVPMNNMKKRDKDYKAKNKGVNARTGMSVFIRAKNNENGEIGFTPTLSKKVKPVK